MDSLHQRWLARASGDTPRILGEPLVSIICFCKNRAATIPRCVESVLGQKYQNIEFVVQDGASTDGTVEILQGYDDRRIKLVSQVDSGPAEACWKALHRCQGDIIGICLSDEELLPDAIERAVAHFRSAPHLGAITCDGFITDPQGKITNEFNAGDFNLVNYLFARYCPFFPGSFFRRHALLDVGLKSEKWNIDCLEFEIWCRLGIRHEVKYIPERMSKYAVHETQLSQTRQYFNEHFDNRALLIRHMFSSEGFFGDNEILRFGCLYNQLYLLYNHVRAYRLQDQVELLGRRLRDLAEQVDVFELARYKKYFHFEAEDDGRTSTTLAVADYAPTANSLWPRLGRAVPGWLRRYIPRSTKDAIRAALPFALYVLSDVRRGLKFVRGLWRQKFRAPPTAMPPAAIKFLPRVYHEVANIYYARGQVEQAVKLWKSAEALGDPLVDGMACQAMLMAPSSRYEDLLVAQKRWAEGHARPVASESKRDWRQYDGKRPIRVGYHCSFMDSDLMRFMLLHTIKRRNASGFEVYGYAPSAVSSPTAAAFDHFRVASAEAPDKFVKLVRSDELDILVEVSGFSPHNCFAAMASRCAPIQISYLNHTGTSAVPNVDYVFADEISVPPADDIHFTETVWRLPGSFLSYNYDEDDLPPLTEVPSLKNGFITFGYFGSGGKLNTQLIDLWAEIMKRVPNSMFFIRNAQLSTTDNRQFLQDRFWRFGIAPERLRILGGAERATILRGYEEVDISLDTWPYCGGNTIAESLWQGVPVVTLKGERFSGKYGASLLTAAGCAELAANSADEYVAISVGLANSPAQLHHYRRNLRDMTRRNGLSDPQQFATKLEGAYTEMMKLRWNVR